MYRAKVICDSISPMTIRLTTMEVEYPRCVLAEQVTHRLLSNELGVEELLCHDRTTTLDMSKNSGSSRAIPFQRMVRKIMDDPFIPDTFSKNGAGMQGHGVLEGEQAEAAKREWLRARNAAVMHASELFDLGVHKQDVNRLLEPWAWITQIITADDWGWANFFALRCHKDADPKFRKIARMMYLAYHASAPEKLDYNEWHLPYVKPEEKQGFRWVPMLLGIPDLLQFSAARCSWVSYENHEQDGTPEKMKAQFQRLVGSFPVHASPTEHQATPTNRDNSTLRSNLRGWVQARKLIDNEMIYDYSPTEEEVRSWGL